MKYAEGERCPSCGSADSEVVDIRKRWNGWKSLSAHSKDVSVR